MSPPDDVLSIPDMAASWDHLRGPSAARILVALAAEHGIDAARALAGTGLRPDDLERPDTVVEAAVELTIARTLLRAAGDAPGLGLQAGARYTVGSLGVWGFALLTSPTVADLVRLGVRYAALSFAFIRPVATETAAGIRVVLDDREIPDDVRAFFVERELAKLATLLPVTIADPAGVTFETRFTGARAAALRAVVPGIRTGAADHALTVARHRLDDPLPQADPASARALEAQCAALLDERRRRSGVAARVRAQLLARPGELVPMTAVAAELAMDERTLRRHLTAEGTSFRELADEVRETLAVELLTTGGLTVEEAAHRLGFHDAAGFSRAVRRWTGRTPGQLKASALSSV